MSQSNQSPTASASGASSGSGRPESTSVLARVAAKSRANREARAQEQKKPETAKPTENARSGGGVEESFRHETMDKEVCDCGRKMTAMRGADNIALRYCPECDHCAPGDDADFQAV